jgi:hypothetical protein
MNIFIISIDHSFQIVEEEIDSAQLRTQKRALRELLQIYLAEHKVAMIFEESSPSKVSIAHRLASHNDPSIPWHNINMTDDERQAANILDELKNRPYHYEREPGNLVPSEILHRIPADFIREDFFINRILEAEDSDRDVLVLMGNMHVIPVAEKLRAMGHRVDLRDELMPIMHT